MVVRATDDASNGTSNYLLSWWNKMNIPLQGLLQMNTTSICSSSGDIKVFTLNIELFFYI